MGKHSRLYVKSVEHIPSHYLPMASIGYAVGMREAYTQFSTWLTDGRAPSIKLKRTDYDSKGPVYFDPNFITPDKFGEGMAKVVQELVKLRTTIPVFDKYAAKLISDHFDELLDRHNKASNVAVEQSSSPDLQSSSMQLLATMAENQCIQHKQLMDALKHSSALLERLIAQMQTVPQHAFSPMLQSHPNFQNRTTDLPVPAVEATKKSEVAFVPVEHRVAPPKPGKPMTPVFRRILDYLRSAPPVGTV
jgi:hypothetical protein